MFGVNQQQGSLLGGNTGGGGGLFNSMQQSQQPQGGGLFGNSTMAQGNSSQFGGQGMNTAQVAGQGGMGQGQQAGSNQGLFGQSLAQSTVINPGSNTGGALFGQGQQQQQQAGLFGQQQQQPQGGGGLFATQNPGQSSMGLGQGQNQGGLFGGAQQQQGGLQRENQQQQLGGGGGLFGGQQQQPGQQAPGGGLFGGQQQQPGQQAGGALFGGQQQQQGQAPGGGLFGGQQQQPGQQAGGLFGNTGQAGGLGQQNQQGGLGMQQQGGSLLGGAQQNQGMNNMMNQNNPNANGSCKIPYKRSMRPQDANNKAQGPWYVNSYNHMQSFTDKSLQQMRLEDYLGASSNNLPQNCGQMLKGYLDFSNGTTQQNMAANQAINTVAPSMAGNTMQNPIGMQQTMQNQNSGSLLGGQPQQSGGLFGGQKPLGAGLTGGQQQGAQGGGLFGGQPQQQGQAGGGLFGGQQQQQGAQGGGLFGGQQQPGFGNKPLGAPAMGQGGLGGNTGSQGGLFGGAQQQGQQGGGLFGGQQQQQGQMQGGLMGQNQQQGQQGGGLFGGQQQGQMQGGLVGQNQQQGQQGGGLFGGQQQQQGGGGLFGQQQQNPSQGGLFGGSNTGLGAGLGGGLNQQKPGGQFGGMQGNQAVNDPQRGGNFGGSFGPQAGLGMQNQQQANMMGNNQGGMVPNAQNQQMNVSYPYGGAGGNMGEPYCVYYIPWSAKTKFETQLDQKPYEEKTEILENKDNKLSSNIDEVKLQEKAFANLHYDSALRNKAEDYLLPQRRLKFGYQSDPYEAYYRSQSNRKETLRLDYKPARMSLTKSSLMPINRSLQDTSTPSIIIANNVNISRSENHSYNSLKKISPELDTLPGLIRLNSTASQKSAIHVDTSRSRQENVILRKHDSVGLGSAHKLTKRNSPSLMDTEGYLRESPIVLSIEMGSQEYKIRADMKWSIETVINQVFTENEDLFYGKESEDYYVEYNNSKLKNDRQLSNVPGLVNYPRLNLYNTVSYTDSTKLSKNANLLAEKDLVPTLRNAGYTTSPSYVDLCRMNYEEQGNVKDFSIENEFGKITWLQQVDLRGLNLDEVVTIKKGMVEVYKDEEDSNYTKAKIGEGLNKPAMVTFFNISKKKNTTEAIFRAKIEEGCKQNGTKLVEWNPKQKEFTIQVSSF